MGIDAVAIGTDTIASGNTSFAQGDTSVASGEASSAMGINTNASNLGSHAEGASTTASGRFSHAEGLNTTSEGTATHTEGSSTRASAFYSHAEGFNTVASSDYCHSEGINTVASNTAAHAEGFAVTASGAYSHAANFNSIAQNQAQTAIGRYNVASNPANSGLQVDDAFIIGNGNSSTRSNAFRVQFTGDVHSATGLYTTGADYAEMFEWHDKNPDGENRIGFFVTLDGEYIRKATNIDHYILGVTSSSPSVVGDTHGCNWQGMYMRNKFGEIIYEWADQQQVVTVYNQVGGKPEVQKQTVHQLRPKLNPEYDASQPYVPRSQRIEWEAVGLIGKLIVRDDGSCKPNGYCWPNAQGIGTISRQGYRVLKRLDTDIILICLK